ncbi:MAG TPA: CHASE2 domain-containing protein [Usitatibacter sp.]|nr:CHASE2 domain-containing protein [Usitatibacter sp.]
MAHGLRAAGALERIDLGLHDQVARSVASSGADERFVLVLETEADLPRWGFPLPDAALATVLEKVLADGPIAIGMDKYRDRPVEPGSERLAALLANASRVVWVEKFGATPTEGVPAPAAIPRALVGCGDVIQDADGQVRRALLYLDRADKLCYAMPLQLARMAAAARGVSIGFPTEAPGHVDLGTTRVKAIDPGDGPYALADTAGFQVAIPTASGVPAMREVSLTELLEGRVPPGTFRDRVVLFGSAAESLRDFFTLPGATGNIPGVQVHALVASHLLRLALGEARPIRLVPQRLNDILAGAMAALGAIAACVRRRPWVAIAFGAGMLVALALLVQGLAARGTYVAPAAPLLATVLVLSAGMARTAWLEHRERSSLMMLFSRHVSSEVADELWKRRAEFVENGVLVPRSVEATVLFLDIRGFTTVIEKLPREVAVSWLNRGLAAMTQAIMRNGGVVTRFSGDAIMAVFGAPVPRTTRTGHEADARNALSAALAIAPALDHLNKQSAAERLPPIRVRIGIDSGPVVQCSVGAQQRMEFTLLGDTVNTAARLESYPMDDDGATARILVSDRALALAGPGFDTRLVGTLALKGKQEAVTLHQVLLPPSEEKAPP